MAAYRCRLLVQRCQQFVQVLAIEAATLSLLSDPLQAIDRRIKQAKPFVGI
jgi:hypothetical protein